VIRDFPTLAILQCHSEWHNVCLNHIITIIIITGGQNLKLQFPHLCISTLTTVCHCKITKMLCCIVHLKFYACINVCTICTCSYFSFWFHESCSHHILQPATASMQLCRKIVGGLRQWLATARLHLHTATSLDWPEMSQQGPWIHRTLAVTYQGL